MENPQWEGPVIENYGKVKYFKNAALQPDKIREYKAVFSVTVNEDPQEVNNHLFHVALLLNVLEVSGVSKENIKVAVVISGGGTDIALNNESYKKIHGNDNPSIDIEKKLSDNGVKFYVCGQSMAEHKYDESELNEYTLFSLSALTDLLILQQQGYILLA